MVYESLVARAAELSSRSLATVPAPEAWLEGLPERRREWLDMLGLDPLPARTDLKVTTTGVLDRGHYVIEILHFQPVPGCYIGANIYRPKEITEPLPGVVYVCGHAGQGKVWYQPHARWFGEHGYVCLILDTIEIGESQGTHHGVYREGWWQWYSQGYSPTAVEVWYAMRAADLLQSRDDVDGSRLGITGNSGGGSVSWYTGAADDRFGVVAPSCQSGTMEQHIRDRTLDGHCDCTVWINNLGWDLADVAALMTPRALLVASATEDTLWRPWSNRELFIRVRGLYRALGLEERFDVVEDAIPHGYSPKTRTTIFNWFERHLKGVESPNCEDVSAHEEAIEDLWAFPEGQPPTDDRTPDIHTFFLPLPKPEVAKLEVAAKRAWLRDWTFRTIPLERETPAYRAVTRGRSREVVYTHYDFETEPGLWLRAWLAEPEDMSAATPLLIAPARMDARHCYLGQGSGVPLVAGVSRLTVEVRGTGNTSIGSGLEWFVRRAYPLLGQSLGERWVHDVVRAVDVLRTERPEAPLAVGGLADLAPIAIYAALCEPGINEVVLADPMTTHWDPDGPEFCGVLRCGDLPENARLLDDQPLTFVGDIPEPYRQQDFDRSVKAWRDWRPRPRRAL